VVLNEGRARRIMEERGLVALVAVQPSNVAYAADFAGLLHYELMEQIYIVLFADDVGHPAAVLPMGEARDLVSDTDAGLASIEDVRPYGTYVIHYNRGTQLDKVESLTRKMIEAKKYGSPMDALCSALSERCAEGGKVGLDDELVPVVGYEAVAKRIERSMRGSSVTPGSKVLRDVRLVKTEEEVDRLRRAATTSEAAFEEAMKCAKEGATGRELVLSLMGEVIRGGCLFKSQMYCTLSLGRKSYLQDAVHPARGKLKRGDLIRFDGGGAYRFYSSDIARNAVLGRASQEQRHLYSAVLAGEQAVIDRAVPGVKASELYRASVDVVRKGWIPDFDRAHCGHTIGVDTYDGVMLAPGDDTVLEEGMVLNPETPYDEFGMGKFHVEDPILVTSGGAHLLTRGHRDLLEV
jgi:Xaa-Pro aminopeptidase